MAIDDLYDDTLMVIFMNRLSDDLHEEVRLFLPSTSEKMIERTQEVEKKNAIIDNQQVTRPVKSDPKAF